MRDEEVHTIPPGLQILLDPIILPGLENPPFQGEGGRTGGLPFPFPDISRRDRKEGGEDRIPRPKDSVIPSIQLFPGPREPEEAQGSMDIVPSVKCDNEKMIVAIEKDSFQVSCSLLKTGHLLSILLHSAFTCSLLLLNFGDLVWFLVGWSHFRLAVSLTWFLLFSVKGEGIPELCMSIFCH